MKISWEWLSQYVDLEGLTPEVVANALTNSGLEVEGLEQTGGAFQGVIVAKVLAVNPHPNADRLRLVTVATNPDQQNQVVCGAPNVKEGLWIAYAQLGAQVLSRKDNSLFTLEKATIRGVESCGMICSLEELGLQDQYTQETDGIWEMGGHLPEAQLQQNWGVDLKSALGLVSDVILETAPTANRGDQMSYLGVAREVAALFDRKMTPPSTPSVTTISPSVTPEIQVTLSDTELCTRYIGIALSGITIQPSPDWLIRRLTASGVRPINAVVDVTNYVLLETGQPLHAFDTDCLLNKGKTTVIDVRKALPGEQLTTLDGVERPLSAESLVVTGNNQPIALAGVMGGQETEIHAETKRVFLEAAVFPSALCRRSAKSVGLRTDASARFERGVDPGATKAAADRAVTLLQQLNPKITVEAFTASPEALIVGTVQLSLRISRLQRIIGLALSAERVETILARLGFTVTAKDADSLQVSIPSFRQHDVTREIDLIEEVIRIEGYDTVPYTLPQNPVIPKASKRQRFITQLDQTLSAAGLQEVMTTSLIGPALLEKTGFSLDPAQTVTITNSHSEEHTLMRQSLLPNLLEIAKYNQAQGQDNVWIYELGRTYFKLPIPPKAANNKTVSPVAEKLYASVLITGNPLTGDWHTKANTDFYRLKGILESLLKRFHCEDAVSYEACDQIPALHPGKTARLLWKANQKPFAILGELHPLCAERLKFRNPVYLMEIDVEQWMKGYQQLNLGTQTLALSAYPPVERDISFLADDTLSHQQIEATLKQLKNPLLQRIKLFDEFRGDKLGPGKRSLAYRLTLQSTEETLSDGQIEQVVQLVKTTLQQQLGVAFR